MIKYLRLPFHFDVIRMQEELRLLETQPWKLHHQILHYEGDWSALPFRSINGIANNIIVSPEENAVYKDTVFLERCPYFKKILSSFNCSLKSVRLLKLNAGAFIKEHTDAELCFEKQEIRIHIPIVTHDAVEFYLDKEEIKLKEGECWYMNFNLPHSIFNKSNIDRVHLVIDADVNDWVKSIFTGPDIIVKKEIEDRKDSYDIETKKMMIERFREMNTETSHKLADDLEKELSQMQ